MEREDMLGLHEEGEDEEEKTYPKRKHQRPTLPQPM